MKSGKYRSRPSGRDAQDVPGTPATEARPGGGRAAPARQGLDPAGVAGTLLEGQSVRVLQALGLVSASGAANADAHRKIKQIVHFVRQITPALDEVFARHPEPVLFDAAAGKSYLAFVVYERWIARLGRGRMVACEARPELAAKVRQIAGALGWSDRFEVIEGRIIAAALPERVHFTLALHACDTATDEALVRALECQSDQVALVPCCQAEVAQLLKTVEAGPSTLWRHAWHRREFGAHLTNVLRALALQAHGYQVTVTELAGWEHSLKNELILGRRVARFHRGAQAELAALLGEIAVQPWLVARLGLGGVVASEAGDAPEGAEHAAGAERTAGAEGLPTA